MSLLGRDVVYECMLNSTVKLRINHFFSYIILPDSGKPQRECLLYTCYIQIILLYILYNNCSIININIYDHLINKRNDENDDYMSGVWFLFTHSFYSFYVE